MSRGPGKIQRFLKATFDAEPQRRFTTRELATAFYGPNPTEWQRQTINRSLKTCAEALGLTICRRGQLKHRGGAEYVWGKI